MKPKDITGLKSGLLTALYPTGRKDHGSMVWRCRCDCGNECDVPSRGLVSGGRKSCGCLKRGNRVRDLTGQRFGSLTAIEPTDERYDGQVVWRCRCDCGNVCDIPSRRLISGTVMSCGCQSKRAGAGKKFKRQKAKDLSGMRFGRLVALEPTGEKKRGYTVWRCQCDCGTICEATTSDLTSGHKQSCGCLQSEKSDDLTGRRFGKLVVVGPTEKRDGSGNIVWRCRCDCGNECDVGGKELKSGNTGSCGCGNAENRAKIGGRAPHADGTHLGVIAKKEPQKRNKTGVTGVFFDERKGKYKAQISLRGHKYNLGSYDDVASAAEARREAEIELFEPILEAHGRDISSEADYESRLSDAVAREKAERIRERHMRKERERND